MIAGTAEENAKTEVHDLREGWDSDREPQRIGGAEVPIQPADDDEELRLINAATFGQKAVKERTWLVDGLIPEHNVTLLGGDGGTGKSLLILQLAFSVATGSPWLGRTVPRGNVLFVSAEDEPDEIHRRLARIVHSEGKHFADLADFNILSLSDRPAVLVKSGKSDDGKLAKTPLFRYIYNVVEQHRPSLVILDTLADFFAGDENNRTETREFVSLLRRMAIKSSATIVLLSHPSQHGMTTGAGTSGSTAWSNSCRSRLYFETDAQRSKATTRRGAKADFDPDVRYLLLKKANYSRSGAELRVRWSEGRFVEDHSFLDLDGESAAFAPRGRSAAAKSGNRTQTPGTEAKVPFAPPTTLSQPIGASMASPGRPDARDVVMSLVAAYRAEGRVLSPKGGRNSAPKILALDERAMGYSRKELKAAMDQLLLEGLLTSRMTGYASRGRCELDVIEGTSGGDGGADGLQAGDRSSPDLVSA